jgi:hypothetical protein
VPRSQAAVHDPPDPVHHEGSPEASSRGTLDWVLFGSSSCQGISVGLTVPGHGLGFMSGRARGIQNWGAVPQGFRNEKGTGSPALPIRSSDLSRSIGLAVFAATVAQIGGRDYSLVGAANQEEMGKIRYVGRFREWAVAAAIVLAVFAALSWSNAFFFLIFLVSSLAFLLLALMLHFRRPVVEVEEFEWKSGNSRRTATKYPPP